MSANRKFIESICFQDRNYQLLNYHQQRVNRTFAHFFKNSQPLNLKEILPALSSTQKSKVRLVYDQETFTVEATNYQPKAVNSLQIIHHETIDYTFKHHDRSTLNKLYDRAHPADDMIIVKNGKITDSYYANLAFRDNDQWYTPETCLLAGVKRQFLIETGKLIVTPICIGDIKNYQTVSLINAMLDLSEIEIPVTNIHL